MDDKVRAAIATAKRCARAELHPNDWAAEYRANSRLAERTVYSIAAFWDALTDDGKRFVSDRSMRFDVLVAEHKKALVRLAGCRALDTARSSPARTG